jgi:phage-related protein
LRLRQIRSGEWRIVAVCTPRGDCPLLEFLATQQGHLARDSRRMLRLLERVAQQGPPRNTDVSHQIGDSLWEFIQGQLRVLWFYDEGRIVVCSHGFVKKGRKAPRGEIARARESQDQYRWARRKGEITIQE